MDLLQTFCDRFEIDNKTKLDSAIGFIWFHSKITNENECTVKVINEYFAAADLPKYNPTYLKRDLGKSKHVTKGSKDGLFRLVRKAISKMESDFGSLFEEQELSITAQANLSLAPLLDEEDVLGAHRMAELYVIIHCYENSVRRLLQNTFSKTFGANWWDEVSNSGMVKKFTDRRLKEEKNKWLTPRGSRKTPLYYLDWGDLVSLIRKYSELFEAEIHDIKFAELRLSELEKTRNIVAHNGTIPSEDDYQRVVLSFKDWCKQIGT